MLAAASPYGSSSSAMVLPWPPRTAPLPSGFASLAHFVTFLPPWLIFTSVAEGVIGVAIGAAFGWTGVGGVVAAFFIGDALSRAGSVGKEARKRYEQKEARGPFCFCR